MMQTLQFGLARLRGFLSGAVVCALLVASPVFAQDTAAAGRPLTVAQSTGKAEAPEANPGRPTISTPATLTPVGYVQFETGMLAAWHSAEFSSQTSFGNVTKWTVVPRLQVLVSTNPYAHSDTEPNNGTGDTLLGVQGVVHPGDGVRPTVALSYFGRIYSGDSADLDIGSARQSALALISADVRGFHYDTNYLVNEQIGGSDVRRAQFGQTLSVSHSLSSKFGLSGEIWHFTQPLLQGNAVGNLWAVNYNAKRNLVLDTAVNRGLTGTSTRWELLAGFTYLLPQRLGPRGPR